MFSDSKVEYPRVWARQKQNKETRGEVSGMTFVSQCWKIRERSLGTAKLKSSFVTSFPVRESST